MADNDAILANSEIVAPEWLIKKSLAVAKRRGIVRAAIVCPHNALVMESIATAVRLGLCKPVFSGNADSIKELARRQSYDISADEIVDCGSDDALAAQQSAALAASGEVDIIIKGHIHSDTLMRAIVSSKAGLRTEKRISHVFAMSFAGVERLLMVTDAVINIQPTAEFMQDIIYNAVMLSRRLGLAKPKVALLSASEDILDAMPSTLQAAALEKWAKEQFKDEAIVEGPFALDNAISKSAAKLKGIDKQVAGEADILVVPDIVSGNILFKSLVYFRGCCALGCVLGAKVPIVLTSRADGAASRLSSIALAVMAC